MRQSNIQPKTRLYRSS